ncbi:MAG: site-2 protease family protein [Planctomycetes bacterium]|nr:site-2 protease family protein [Planctomycetota bacterium]
MLVALGSMANVLAESSIQDWVYGVWRFIKVLIGFSIIIFVHELGHFLAAKWVGVRVDRFAVGFGYRLCGFRRGEGFTFGHKPNYKAEELKEKGYGETDYCFKALPLGGYVKMLGQDDIVIDEKTGDVQLSNDPRAFTSRPVGQRMLVVSAGVVFNVIFAALLFMVAFLAGLPRMAPVLGDVEADGPAARAGLLSGDRVLAIDDQPTHSFRDLMMAGIFSDGSLRLKIERAGEVLPEEVIVTPEWDERRGYRLMGVGAPLTTRLIEDGEPCGERPIPLAGDRITHVDGVGVQNVVDVIVAFARGGGGVTRVTVERSDPDRPGGPPIVKETFQQAYLYFLKDQARGNEDASDRQNLLGMVPRRTVSTVISGKPADKAGFKRMDTIARWGTLDAPTYSEITDSNAEHDGKSIPVVVRRDGKRVELSVTPKRPFQWFGTPKPIVGLVLHLLGEQGSPIVATVVPGTPAAELNLPRGARLLAVDGQETARWSDVVAALMSAAGRTVEVRFRTGGDEVVARMKVPSSIVNGLDLPPFTSIRSIAGKRKVELEAGGVVHLPSPTAVRELLKQHIGETVGIAFVADRKAATSQTRSFTVRADNIDPWQMRVQYLYNPLNFKPLTTLVDAGGNPLAAMWMGIQATYNTLLDVYLTIKFMAKRRVSVENVSGPVGIVSHAMKQAEQGYPTLMFFLAFLSVNLAVINFLPLPVMDGGMMVFLLIEKVKGSPLSIKTQMISTIIGLAFIVLCFVFVTFQDIAKLIGS